MIYFKDKGNCPDLNSTEESSISGGQSWRQKKYYTAPVKILSTKNDVRIRKELLLLRKFLNLDVEQAIRIIDNTDGLVDGKPEKLTLDKVIKKASKEVEIMPKNVDHLPPREKKREQKSEDLNLTTEVEMTDMSMDTSRDLSSKKDN